jgi:hypothetical protein
MFDGVCQIRPAGVTPEGRAQLDLKAENGSFDWTWCISKTAINREVLAIALAAITSNKLVFCQMDQPVGPWSEVHRIVIVK